MQGDSERYKDAFAEWAIEECSCIYDKHLRFIVSTFLLSKTCLVDDQGFFYYRLAGWTDDAFYGMFCQ